MIALTAGTYAYVASIAGKESGKTTITVTRNADGTTRIAEDGSGQANGMAGTAKATMALGADAAPTAYAAHVDVGGTAFDTAAVFAGATATVDGLGGKQTFTLASGQHFAVLDGGLVSGFIALPVQASVWAGSSIAALVPIYGQSAPLVVDATAKPVRPNGIPAGDASVSVSAPIALVEWYDPATMILDELDVPSQGLVVARKRS